MEAQYIEINKVGDKFYYKDRAMTILHRTDGPAVEYTNGTKAWFVNGGFHRTDGPAFEGFWGDKEWRIDGKLHRTDGPAIEWDDGSKGWALNGERISESEFNRRTSPEIVLTMDEIAAKLGVDVSKLKIKK